MVEDKGERNAGAGVGEVIRSPNETADQEDGQWKFWITLKCLRVKHKGAGEVASVRKQWETVLGSTGARVFLGPRVVQRTEVVKVLISGQVDLSLLRVQTPGIGNSRWRCGRIWIQLIWQLKVTRVDPFIPDDTVHHLGVQVWPPPLNTPGPKGVPHEWPQTSL